MVFQILEWIQDRNGYSYNHRVESVKGGGPMHSDAGHFYNMKRGRRGRTSSNYFVGGSIGGSLGGGSHGGAFRDYMNGGGIFGSGRSQSYMGPAGSPGNSSNSGYGADIPGGSGGGGGGGGGGAFGKGGCSHFNGGRC